MVDVSVRGRLLVAGPMLRDPNFARTVVLILEHNEDGAVGLVLNHPSETAVAEVLPGWADTATAPPVVYAGGPVQPTAAICLVRVRDGAAIDGWAPLHDRLGTLDLDVDAAVVGPALERLRVFAGYAGWGRGQLEGELATGAWYVVDPLPEDAFFPEPARLWESVLRRQPGDLRLLATFPPDPRLN